jgi:hypothetical protein
MPEVIKIACRSAFRVGQPDDLCESHIMRMAFLVDESDQAPSNIRQRFKLTHAGIDTYEAVLRSMKKIDPELYAALPMI